MKFNIFSVANNTNVEGKRSSRISRTVSNHHRCSYKSPARFKVSASERSENCVPKMVGPDLPVSPLAASFLQCALSHIGSQELKVWILMTWLEICSSIISLDFIDSSAHIRNNNGQVNTDHNGDKDHHYFSGPCTSRRGKTWLKILLRTDDLASAWTGNDISAIVSSLSNW